MNDNGWGDWLAQKAAMYGVNPTGLSYGGGAAPQGQYNPAGWLQYNGQPFNYSANSGLSNLYQRPNTGNRQIGDRPAWGDWSSGRQGYEYAPGQFSNGRSRLGQVDPNDPNLQNGAWWKAGNYQTYDQFKASNPNWQPYNAGASAWGDTPNASWGTTPTNTNNNSTITNNGGLSSSGGPDYNNSGILSRVRDYNPGQYGIDSHYRVRMG